MAFLDNLNKKITAASQTTISKTKELTGLAKYNAYLYEEEKKMNAACAEIGRLYYEQHKEEADNEYRDIIERIIESEKKIGEYREQIRTVKEEAKDKASSIKAILDEKDEADEVLQAESDVANGTGKRCANCGTPLTTDGMFCIKCGMKIEDAE